ncbi:MAG: ThiF family adenylyltransferase [Planctomycetes bacterium]|nr:ThiF family adenylyltransferase [Planctomycetota bacterium]
MACEHAASVVIVGAGGNIGSHLVPHVGRLPEVGRVVLVDPDTYERSNLASQDIDACDVGRAKVEVQAARLARIRPELAVETEARPVQSVPLGRLRGDVILTALDSRESRRWVNQAAFRLGVPWIDAGVQADGLLARITMFRPAHDLPCLECAWQDQDFAHLEVAYPCGGTPAAATGAPSALGALAASLQALECRNLLTGRPDTLPPGHEVLLDARHRRHFVTRLVRNPSCRFDHRTWAIERLDEGPARLSLRGLARRMGSAVDAVSFAIEEHPFASRLVCARCGRARATLVRPDRLAARDRTCRRCGGDMIPSGFHLLDRVALAPLSRRFFGRYVDCPLGALGLQAGDVLRVDAYGRDRHFELGRD